MPVTRASRPTRAGGSPLCCWSCTPACGGGGGAPCASAGCGSVCASTNAAIAAVAVRRNGRFCVRMRAVPSRRWLGVRAIDDQDGEMTTDYATTNGSDSPSYWAVTRHMPRCCHHIAAAKPLKRRELIPISLYRKPEYYRMFGSFRPRGLLIAWSAGAGDPAGRLRLRSRTIPRLWLLRAAATMAARTTAAALWRSAAAGMATAGAGTTGTELAWYRSQPRLLQSQDRPRAGLSARHQAVDAQELVRAVRLAADRPHRADRRRADAGGEA